MENRIYENSYIKATAIIAYSLICDGSQSLDSTNTKYEKGRERLIPITDKQSHLYIHLLRLSPYIHNPVSGTIATSNPPPCSPHL